MKNNRLKKGKKYAIRYKGMFDYNDYHGEGTYTGKKEDIDGMCYEFVLDNGNTGFFPLGDVFEL